MRAINHNFKRISATFMTLALAFAFCLAFAMPASAEQYFGSRPQLNVHEAYASDHVIIEFAPGITDINQKAALAAADPLFLTIDPSPIADNTYNAYVDEYATVEQVVALGYTSPEIVSIQLDASYFLGEEKVVGFDYGYDGIYQTANVALGDTVAPIANPYLDGYTFTGWYTDDGARYDFNQPVNGDMWLTASWEANAPAPAAPVVSGNYNNDTVEYAYYTEEPAAEVAPEPEAEATPAAAAAPTETITDNATPLSASPRSTAAAIDNPGINVEDAQPSSTWMIIAGAIVLIALVAAGLTIYSVVRSKKNGEEA